MCVHMCDDEEERDSRIFDVFIFLIDELKNFFFRIFALEIDLDFRE